MPMSTTRTETTEAEDTVHPEVAAGAIAGRGLEELTHETPLIEN